MLYSSLFWRLVGIGGVLLTLIGVGHAHDLKEGVGTQSFFRFFPAHVELKFNFGVATPDGGIWLAQVDANRDGKVSKEEKLAWLGQKAEDFTKEVDLHINGRPASLKHVSTFGVGLIGRVMNTQFDTFFTYETPLPAPLPDGGWWIHYRDRSCEGMNSTHFVLPVTTEDGGASGTISFLIFEPSSDRIQSEIGLFRIPGRRAVFFVDDEFTGSVLPGQTPVPTIESLAALELDPKTAPKRGAVEGRESDEPYSALSGSAEGETNESQATEPQATEPKTTETPSPQSSEVPNPSATTSATGTDSAATAPASSLPLVIGGMMGLALCLFGAVWAALKGRQRPERSDG